jgi:hypothetical protein
MKYLQKRRTEVIFADIVCFCWVLCSALSYATHATEKAARLSGAGHKPRVHGVCDALPARNIAEIVRE